MSYMELAHRYHIQNMEQKMDIQDIHLHGTSVKYIGGGGNTVSMTMDFRELERLAQNDKHYHEIMAEQEQEIFVRDSVPAVAAAYEQYQLLLKLVK